MKKIKLLLVVLLSVFVVGVVHAVETTSTLSELTGISKQIVDVRNNTSALKRITNSNFKVVKEGEGLTVDESGNPVYKFALGCKLGETCTYSVTYGGQVESVSGVTVDEAASAWNAGKTVTENGKEIEIQPKNRWNSNGMNHGTISLTNGAAGNYYAIYSNVGRYGDTNIDVKASVVDLETIDEDSVYRVSEPAIVFRNDQIGVSATGVRWVKVKYEFFESGTETPVEIKGNTSYWDIDQNQGVIIVDETNKGIYYVEDGLKCKKESCTEKYAESVKNQLYFSDLTEGTYIFDQDSGIGESRIYKDNLKSTAYAFTEEFEGTDITRVFQFSDPMLKSYREDENTWTGHGAIYLSGTAVTEKYILTTEVVHGTIVPEEGTVTEYEYGDTAIVTYQPETGYELSYIEIDGTKVELGENIEIDKLQIEMDQKHHVKVVYVIKSAKTGLFEVGGVLLILVGAFVAYKIAIKKKTINEI